MRTSLQVIFSILVVCGGWSTGHSATVDFADFDLQGAVYLDTPESLFFEDVGGEGINVTVVGGADLRIYDLVLYSGDDTEVGQGLLDWFWPSGSNTEGTEISFSRPVASVSLRAGDYGSDDDTPLRIQAFDAEGALIGEDTADWPLPSYPPFATLMVNATGIRSIRFSSGGIYAGSTFVAEISFSEKPTAADRTVWGAVKAQYR